MRILMINSVCGIRSTGRICADTADVLIAEGNECKIAYGRESVPERFENLAVRIGTDLDVKIHGLKTRLLDMHGLGSRSVTKKFVKWVEEYDPDIIHLHNIHGYYLNIVELFNYLSRTKKPIVWTFHDCWPFTGHCSYFDFCNCSKWREKGCYSCVQKKEYPRSEFFDRSKKNYLLKKNLFTNVENMTIVTPSMWLAKLVKESFLKEYPVKIVHNGIDLSAFKPSAGNDVLKKYNLEKKKIILGVASVWESRKGFLDFLRLAKLVSGEYQIVLVGLAEDQIAVLPKNITGLTRTDNVNELAQLYASANVFFNPTYEDNFPTTNIESLACGTPVITYNTGGSPEALVENCGWVFEKGDVDGVIELLNKIDSKEKYIHSCVERAKYFDKKRMCEDYIAVYKEIVDR